MCKELTYEDIVMACNEAKRNGEDCEVFFLNEHPEIEGYLISLSEEFGWTYHFAGKGVTSSWVIKF